MFWDPIRIEPPAVLPVTLAELKAQTRYFASEEDAIMQGMLRASVEIVENFTGLALIDQVWTQAFSAFPSATTMRLTLKRRPVQEVLSVAYLDSDGLEQAADPLTYQVAGLGNDHACATVRIGSGASWPTVYGSTDQGVVVTFRAGFGPDHNFVPEQIRQAILLEAASLFGYRENYVLAATVSSLPETSKTLLSDWRPLAVA